MSQNVSLRINGQTVSTAYDVSKTAATYAGEFMAAFVPLFPQLTFSVSPGGNLSIVAPEGMQLEVTAYGEQFVPVVHVRSSREKAEMPVIVVINSGLANTSYRISLNGRSFFHNAGDTNHPATWNPEAIAEGLRSVIVNYGYIVQRFANILVIRDAEGKAISFGVSDTFDNKAISAYKGRVNSEAELPPWLDEGTVLAVGDPKDGGYYVRFAYRDSLSGALSKPNTVVYPEYAIVEGNSRGVYEETYLPGVRTTFVADTMPHILVREANGTFTFKKATWAERAVGDEVSVPAASFEGKKINDLFFFRNRLGLLTDETLVFSKSGKFFDFWPDTAKDVLDTDPIDVVVSTERVSQLHYAVPFNTNTLLFGENSQFLVAAQGTLTPKSISVQPTTNFEMSKQVRPLAIGPSVFFVADKDKWSSVWEYYVQQGTYANTAEDVTQQVPKFIPAGVYQLTGSASENMVIGLNKTNRRALSVYQFMWSGDKKVQSAWGYWTFYGEVLNAAFMGSKLYLAVKYANEGIYLERIDLQEPVDTALVDRKGHANWKRYDMVYEFSPQYLQNQQGNLVGGKRKLKTVTVNHSGLGWLYVGILQKDRDAVWRLFPDEARDLPFQGNREWGNLRAGLSGDATETRVVLFNNSNAQTIIRSAEFELTNDMRARRV